MKLCKIETHFPNIGDLLSLEPIQVRLNSLRSISQIDCESFEAFFQLSKQKQEKYISHSDSDDTEKERMEQTNFMNRLLGLANRIPPRQFRINIHDSLKRMRQSSQQPPRRPSRKWRARRQRIDQHLSRDARPRGRALRYTIVTYDPDPLQRSLEALGFELAPFQFREDRALRFEHVARHFVLEVLEMAVLEEGFDNVGELGVFR